MSKNHHISNYPVQPRVSSDNSFLAVSKSCFESDNPAKWIAGLAIGALAITGVAIKTIGELSK